MDPYNPDEEVERLAPIVPDIEATPGGRSKFTAEQLRLEQAAEKSRGSAMELLGKALNNQPEITPSQGFAAALLGAIPTIGGYMMGRSIGRPNIPQGVYFDGISPSQFNEQFGSSGANAGGAMGAQIGANAAQGYFNSREEEVKQQIPILQRQALLEAETAEQLSRQAQTINLHGLEAQERRDYATDPTILNADVSRARQIADAQNKSRQQYLTPSESEAKQPANPALAARLEKQMGLPAGTIKTNGDYERAQYDMKMADINDRHQDRRDDYMASAQVDGTEIIPGFRPQSKAIHEAQNAMTAYRVMKESVIPELKRVFTNPNATIEEKSAAIARTIIAMKKNDDMGANFTLMEMELQKAGLPSFASLSPLETLGYVKQQLQGQDAAVKINRLEEIVDMTAAATLEPRGYRLRSGSGAGQPDGAGAQTKTINGRVYKKVTGGWQAQ